jgi:heme-degrading monooxygenase HmoA
MSVMVIVKVPGDVDKARSLFAERAEEMQAIAESGRAAGALHHKFAVGEHELIVVDEWKSAAAFEAFFSDPRIAALMADGGASGPPAVQIFETLETSDAF